MVCDMAADIDVIELLSHSLLVELTFCIYTPHIIMQKVTKEIFEILI